MTSSLPPVEIDESWPEYYHRVSGSTQGQRLLSDIRKRHCLIFQVMTMLYALVMAFSSQMAVTINPLLFAEIIGCAFTLACFVTFSKEVYSDKLLQVYDPDAQKQ